MLPIKGFQKTSLIDFAPYTASTVFIGGCNFRCKFCHNPSLVLKHNEILGISEQEILDYISMKKKWIDGVCLTGGEPTLYPSLIGFIEKLKALGMLVKLDTNGTNPEMLKRLIDDKLVDSVAMDVKADILRYNEITNMEVDVDKIKQSIKTIIDSGIAHEFRTTVVPGLVEKQDIKQISKMLSGAKKFAIQNFRGNVDLIDNSLKGIKGFSKKELEEMKKIASEYFEEVEVRD
jgi:pyruvate formate lyase activating enzyme